MASDARSEETQLKMLRLLIDETQNSTARFAKELETFAEAFSQTCGHNRLEQIGLRWSGVLTPAQTRLLLKDKAQCAAFALHLHRALMLHLLPTDAEMAELTKTDVMQWTAALRMGIQGVLRRRAQVTGDTSGGAGFPLPNESFLLSMRPVIRRAADDFFPVVPEHRDAAASLVAQVA